MRRRAGTGERGRIESVLEKGLAKKGLELDEVAALINAGPEFNQRIFETASRIKQEIYGDRLVLFAPLYISDWCVNDCEYCNFHRRNAGLKRTQLILDEIEVQTKCLVDMGHKRVLIETGEDPTRNTIDYVVSAIERIYSVKSGRGNIRRVNVNIAATTVENYRRLKSVNIGTYQLFQETYHRPTYERLHNGPKADYERQITAHDRAREAGLDDLGIGALFGLFDWRFEVLALVAHAKYMDSQLGVGPHTISVPRLQSAPSVVRQSQYKVSDDDFLKLIAILRIAVPYTGMILTTREGPELRHKAFKIGISQASAASVTAPGGYGVEKSKIKNQKSKIGAGQFETYDKRPLSEVVEKIVDDGLIPSFCTACYRIGRTGGNFMGLAKPGEIQKFCHPNALLTFTEYLLDYCNGNLRVKGGELVKRCIDEIEDEGLKKETVKRIERIRGGERDLYF